MAAESLSPLLSEMWKLEKAMLDGLKYIYKPYGDGTPKQHVKKFFGYVPMPITLSEVEVLLGLIQTVKHAHQPARKACREFLHGVCKPKIENFLKQCAQIPDHLSDDDRKTLQNMLFILDNCPFFDNYAQRAKAKEHVRICGILNPLQAHN